MIFINSFIMQFESELFDKNHFEEKIWPKMSVKVQQISILYLNISWVGSLHINMNNYLLNMY